MGHVKSWIFGLVTPSPAVTQAAMAIWSGGSTTGHTCWWPRVSFGSSPGQSPSINHTLNSCLRPSGRLPAGPWPWISHLLALCWWAVAAWDAECSPWEWDVLHGKGMPSEQRRAPAQIIPRPKQTLDFLPPCRGTSPPHLTAAFQRTGVWKAKFPLLKKKTPLSPTSSIIFPV